MSVRESQIDSAAPLNCPCFAPLELPDRCAAASQISSKHSTSMQIHRYGGGSRLPALLLLLLLLLRLVLLERSRRCWSSQA